jgi:hypothetical protein
LAAWADRIDAARYGSAREVILAESPALRISTSLSVATKNECSELVLMLGARSLDEVSREPSIATRFAAVQDRTTAGLRAVETALLQSADGIATFVARDDGVVINGLVARGDRPRAVVVGVP